MNTLRTIKAGGVNEHFNLPWIRCAETHGLASYGIDLQWNIYAGGTGDLTTALRKGEIDVAVLLTEGLILDIRKNRELKLIAFHVLNPLRWGIHVPKEAKVPLNYRGCRFAVSRLGSGSHTMAKYLLTKNGIPFSEAKFVEIGSLEGGLNALEKGEADVFLWEKFTTDPFLEKHGLSCVGEVLTPWPPFSIAARRDFAEKETDLLKTIIDRIGEFAATLMKDPRLSEELENRWHIPLDHAREWISQIRWHDQFPVTDAEWDAIIVGMTDAGLFLPETSASEWASIR